MMLVVGMPVRVCAQAVRLEPNRPDTLNEKIQRSHLLDEKFDLRGVDPEQLFQHELNKIHAREILDSYKKDTGNGVKKLDALIQQGPDFVQRFLKEFRFEDLSPELQKRFEGREGELEQLIHSLKLEDLQKYARMAQGMASSPAPGSPPVGTPTGDRPPASEPDAKPGHDEKAAEPEASGPSFPGTDGEAPKANSVLGRWLLQAADRFKELDPSLRNSRTLHQFIDELSRKVEGSDERWKALDREANAIAEKWAHLGQALPLDRLWPKNGFSWSRNLLPQSLPNWKLPEFRRRPERRAAFSMPQGGLPALSQETGWGALGTLALIAGLGLVLWKLWSRSAADRRAGAGGWKLGPWPVRPTAVRTREELIRAFEYLSVLRLGPAARHWHHWAIASALGRTPAPYPLPRGGGESYPFSPLSRGGEGRVRGGGDAAPTRWRREDSAVQRRSAEQLALLYERARYAPPEEPLPEAALAAARRDLCLLAGVPVS
jgi:hypothetical protein